MGCRYEIPWYGICQEDTKGGNTYCEKHLNRTCVVCGNQAVTECGFASSLTCGAPLCGSKECYEKHTSRHKTTKPRRYEEEKKLIKEMLKPENKQKIISKYKKKYEKKE